MYKFTKASFLAMSGALILSACGGGGGSGPQEIPTITLQGSAAKGILINADVAAYPLVNGKQGKTPLATAKTDDNGDYELQLPPSNEPVIIEVRANAATRMLDETQLLVDGRFAQVAAPPNLVMRSFAINATQAIQVRVNPYTEMAVAMAANTGSLSRNSLIAGQQVAQMAAPGNLNPFGQVPASKPADMDDNQLKFAMQMAGLLTAARNNPACDLSCQIASLSKGFVVTVGADGRATVPGSVNLAVQTQKAAVLSAGSAALAVAPGQQSRLNQVKTAVMAEAQSAVATAQMLQNQNSQTSKPEDVVAANGLEGFVKSMRDGFRLTETRLLKAEEDVVKRYEKVTLDGVGFVNRVVEAIEADCNSNAQICSSRTSSSFSWSGSNGNFTWVNTVPDNLGRTSTGTILTSKSADGRVSALVNGSISKNGKQLLTMEGLSINFLDGGYDDFEGTVKGVVKARDSASGLTVSLTFNDVYVWVKPVKLYEIANHQLKGGLTLEASNGDRLSGSFDIKMVDVARRVLFANSQGQSGYEEYITDGTISLQAQTTASGGTMEVLSLDMKLTSSLPDYAKPVSASNVETYSGTVNLALADKLTTLVFTESASTWQTVNQSATIQSGGSEVNMRIAFSSANTNGAWCQWNEVKRCANEITLTSTNANPYTATLTKGSNGRTKGDIFLGATKVGEIVNGVLKINGVEVSLF